MHAARAIDVQRGHPVESLQLIVAEHAALQQAGLRR